MASTPPLSKQPLKKMEESEQSVSYIEEDTTQHSATATFNSRNTRFTRRQVLTQPSPPAAPRMSYANAAQFTPRTNAQPQGSHTFELPTLPALTEIVSGTRKDGTPLFTAKGPRATPRTTPRTTSSRSRFTSATASHPSTRYEPVDNVAVPEDDKAIYANLQYLKERVDQLEMEKSEFVKRAEEHEMEMIHLRSQLATAQRRPDSGFGSSDEDTFKAEKNKLVASKKTLEQQVSRAERKTSVAEIAVKRVTKERDELVAQIGVASRNVEELKHENAVLLHDVTALHKDNDALRQDNDALRQDNDVLNGRVGKFVEEKEWLQGRVDELQGRINEIAEENDDLHALNSTLSDDKEWHREEITSLMAECDKLEQNRDEYAQEVCRLEGLLNVTEEHRTKLLEHAKWLDADNDRCRDIVVDDEKTIAKLRLELEAARGAAVETTARANSAARTHSRATTSEAKDNTRQSLRSVKNDTTRASYITAQSADQSSTGGSFMRDVDARIEQVIKEREQQEPALDTEQASNATGQQQVTDVSISLPPKSEHGNIIDEIRRTSMKPRGPSTVAKYDRSQASMKSRSASSVTGLHHRNDTVAKNDTVSHRSASSVAKNDTVLHHAVEGTLGSRLSSASSAKRASYQAATTRPAAAHVSEDYGEDLSMDFTQLTRTSGKSSKRTSYPSAASVAQNDTTAQSGIDTTQLSRASATSAKRTSHTPAATKAAAPSLREDDSRDLTQLSTMNIDELLSLRTKLEEERKERRAARRAGRTQASTPAPLPLKSSLKDGNIARGINLAEMRRQVVKSVRVQSPHTSDGATEPRQQYNSAPTSPTDPVAPTVASSTSRPRRRAATTEGMTSAFIIPDITLHTSHEQSSCTSCPQPPQTSIKMPKPVPVSSRPVDPDETSMSIRPSQPPSHALATVLKQLEDEIKHLKIDLAVEQNKYATHDPAVSRRRRANVKANIDSLTKEIEKRSDQVYALYDVLEGQKQQGDLNESQVDETLQDLGIAKSVESFYTRARKQMQENKARAAAAASQAQEYQQGSQY